MDQELARLLANAMFVRSIARGVLGREQDLDEVVQETWLAALRSPPSNPRSRSRATVASDGSFTMTVDEPGAYDLLLEADDGTHRRRIRETVVLKLGEQSWSGPE